MKKVLLASIIALFAANMVSAHVVVRPNSAGIGTRQVFAVQVPNEKEVPTVGVRLVIPEGVESVRPNVKPGWRVELKKEKTGNQVEHDGIMIDEEKVTEIMWTGGSIPTDQRDEFEFQALVPSAETSLIWKAYQAYADGSVVAWDQTPGANVSNPYSQTQVVDDLSVPEESWWQKNQSSVNLVLSLLAVVLAGAALVRKQA